jgi:hypothetical protein
MTGCEAFQPLDVVFNPATEEVVKVPEDWGDDFREQREKLRDSLTDVELFSLPKGAPWPMERFVETIKVKCKAGYKELQKKSSMIEDAIEDLISLALEFKPVVDIMPDKKGVTENDDDEDDPRSKRRKKLKETMEEEEDDVPLAPIHVLTCLDKNQIGKIIIVHILLYSVQSPFA